eukprot:372004-Prymnesium_polylepis.3
MHASLPTAAQPFVHVAASALGNTPPSQRTRKMLPESCTRLWSVLVSWISVTLTERKSNYSQYANALVRGCWTHARSNPT